MRAARLLLYGCCVALALTTAHADDANHPNIVLIYADDVGYGDLSAYGAELIQTPRIDGLADGGVRFTDAHATASTCTPSRFSLMTGEYAFRNDASIANATTPLLIEPGTVTLASMLQEAGYTTAMIGKWHLGLGDAEHPVDWNGKIAPGPLEVGFDVSFMIPATNDRVPTVYVDGHHVHNLSPDDDALRIDYDDPIGELPTGHTHPEKLRYAADYQHSGTIVAGISRIGFQDGGQSAWWDDEQMAANLAERGVQFIEDNADDPFFLFLSMHENHVPRAPHPDFIGKSETGLRGDAVVELDWVVGQVMDTLKRLGLAEDTLVIFTSDNGPILFDGYEDGAVEDLNGHRPHGPFRGGKYLPFEGGTRMPTIVHWPAQIESGVVSDALVSQVDLLASLAELVDQQLPEGAAPDSEPLLDVWLGRSTQGREHFIQQPAGPALAVRKGDWKYIEPGNRPDWPYQRHSRGDNPLNSTTLTTGPYLFNLADDPSEEHNLIDEHPELAEQLNELLNQKRDRSQ